MAYRIEYDGEVVHWKQERMHTMRILGYALVCFVLFSAVVYFVWPAGWACMEQLLYPGDAPVTKTALQNMAFNLRSGQALGDAVLTFCREILDGAQIPG